MYLDTRRQTCWVDLRTIVSGNGHPRVILQPMFAKQRSNSANLSINLSDCAPVVLFVHSHVVGVRSASLWCSNVPRVPETKCVSHGTTRTKKSYWMHRTTPMHMQMQMQMQMEGKCYP